MNVLLFAGRFEVRGSSKYTLRLGQHLREHDVDATIVCSDASHVDSGARAGLSLREYPHLGLPVWGRVVMDLIRRDFDDQPPGLIHIQTRSVLSQGTWLARRLDRPAVLTMHDSLGPRERLRVDRTCVRHIITVSEAVRAELIEREGFPDEYVTAIHSGVDVPEIVDAPPVLDPGHTPVVGTAGPLESVKGLPFFLGAAAKVLAVRDSIEFLVAGAGPEERSLRRLARELGITGKVTFIPRLYDFSQSLEAMDIYCLPSLRQGLGTIMLEAMARARPVIAAGVGGVYSAVKDNETGLVVPPSDSGRLAERIVELLDDPLRARVIGEAGRRLVRDEFGLGKMVERTAEIYRAVCGAEVGA